jgi:hypothetical protein
MTGQFLTVPVGPHWAAFHMFLSWFVASASCYSVPHYTISVLTLKMEVPGSSEALLMYQAAWEHTTEN